MQHASTKSAYLLLERNDYRWHGSTLHVMTPPINMTENMINIGHVKKNVIYKTFKACIFFTALYGDLMPLKQTCIYNVSSLGLEISISTHLQKTITICLVN